MVELIPVYYDFLCPLMLGAAILSCAKLLFSNLRQIRFSSVMLVVLVLVFLVPMWNRYISVSNLPSMFLFGKGLVFSFWLIGPLFYLFILHNTQVLQPRWKDGIHALPYLLLLFIISSDAFSMSFPVLLVVWNLTTTAYVILSLQCLHKAKQRREQYLSQALSPLYRWGMLLVFGVFAFILADIAISVFIVLGRDVPPTAFVIFECLRLLVILLLVATFQFSGLQFHNPAITFSDTAETRDEARESRLSSSTASALQDCLQRRMTEQSLYKHVDLSLPKLSETMNISSHELSELLNTHMKVSFYDYVNQMRIEDAKKQLAEAPNMAVVDIAMNSGFNSKSTFYSCFKKYCHMTPTQYRSMLGKGALA